MTAPCSDREIMLQAYYDGELDAAHAQEMETHLRTCAGCAAYFDGLQSLSARLSSANLSPAAPRNLRDRIEASIETEARLAAPRSRPWWNGMKAAWGAAGAMTAVAASLLFMQLAPVQADLEAQLISNHVRSLLADHLYDVATSDRHTVKPWFNGKIEFAPPVPDLLDQGFPLAGGRLDYAKDKVVAAIVYRRRAHVINLFVMPHDAAGGHVDQRREGYSIERWTSGGLDFWAVSDIDPPDLDAFRQAFVAAATP